MLHQPTSAPSLATATSTRFNLRNAKVLVADDNNASIDLVVEVLLGFGVRHTAPCRSLDEARQALESERFHLVIADGEMDGEDGFQLATHIRSDPETANFTVPIIVMSGFTPAHKIARARDLGANLVIKKPVVPGILLSRIEWLARCPREFVVSAGYCGPDRRFHNRPIPEGMSERRADGIRLLEQPDRAMSQDEIDSLFD